MQGLRHLSDPLGEPRGGFCNRARDFWQRHRGRDSAHHLRIGQTVEEIIACDLEFEHKAMADLREAIAYAESVQDYGSRLLYEHILKGEEEHIDYLNTQQRLIAAIGLTDYIQVQTQANAATALDPPGD